LTLIAGASPLLEAASLESSVDLTTAVEYDSNAAFVPDEIAEAVWRGIATPTLTVVRGGDGPRLELDAAVRLQSSSNTDISRNRQDPNVGLRWLRQGLRSEFSLEARYREASTRQTEIDDTNLLVLDGTKKDATGNLLWSYSISDRQFLVLTGNVTDARYEDAVQVDYQSASSSLSYNFRATERFTPFFQIAASRFDPQEGQLGGPPAQQSDLYSAGAGMEVELTPQWNVTVSASAVRIDAQAIEGPLPVNLPDEVLARLGGFADDDWNVDLALAYDGERARFSLSAARATTASGIGGFISGESARSEWSIDTSEVGRVGLRASWRRNREPVENEFVSGGLWYERDLSATWKLRASWDYREQTRRDELPQQSVFTGDAEAHVVVLSLEYRGEQP
jgi:hypothetical protein